MKKKNVIKTLLTAWLLLLVLCVAGTPAEAKKKAKAYKAKTVKVTKGKSKTVKTSKKIKKVKISSKNKNFTVKKTAAKKFKLSGTDVGKTQTVKVTYTNGNTQKYKIKTVKAATASTNTYKKKVLAYLKPLIANPDKGLQKIWEDQKAVQGKNVDRTKYDLYFTRTKAAWYTTYQPNKNEPDNPLNPKSPKYDPNYDPYEIMTEDEIMSKYTASQKQALILEIYCKTRMKYNRSRTHLATSSLTDNDYKDLYNGTYTGACGVGAIMARALAKDLGLEAKATAGDKNVNHAWCNIRVTDKAGHGYWMGIATTSYAYDLKLGTKIDELKNNAKISSGKGIPEARLKKSLYGKKPTVYTGFRLYKKTKKSAQPTPTPRVTMPPVITQAPAQTAAPTPTLSPDELFDKFMPTHEPMETQAPTVAPTAVPTSVPTVTPTTAPTVEPTVAPTPTPTLAPVVRILIPKSEHNYTCPGCERRHPDASNPYVSNKTSTYKTGFVIYAHVLNGSTRYFDYDGNEYIDVNGDGTILDELETLFG